MALNEGDKAIIMQIAEKIVAKSLELHIKHCPVAACIAKKKMLFYGAFIGLSVGSGVGGGSIVWALLKVFS